MPAAEATSLDSVTEWTCDPRAPTMRGACLNNETPNGTPSPSANQIHLTEMQRVHQCCTRARGSVPRSLARALAFTASLFASSILRCSLSCAVYAAKKVPTNDVDDAAGPPTVEMPLAADNDAPPASTTEPRGRWDNDGGIGGVTAAVGLLVARIEDEKEEPLKASDNEAADNEVLTLAENVKADEDDDEDVGTVDD